MQFQIIKIKKQGEKMHAHLSNQISNELNKTTEEKTPTKKDCYRRLMKRKSKYLQRSTLVVPYLIETETNITDTLTRTRLAHADSQNTLFFLSRVYGTIRNYRKKHEGWFSHASDHKRAWNCEKKRAQDLSSRTTVSTDTPR